MSARPALKERGAHVREFGMMVPNLGRIGELTRAILTMLRSKDWRAYEDATGEYHFLPGEYDYFLAEQGVDGRDLQRLYLPPDDKLELQAAMDNKRQAANYRRPVEDVIKAHPRGSLATHWTRHGWAEIKHPVGPRATFRATKGVTAEAHAKRARKTRLTKVTGWKSRVERVLDACKALSRDEVLEVIEGLKQRTRTKGRPEINNHDKWLTVARQQKFSPTRCARVWEISADAARKRLTRLDRT